MHRLPRAIFALGLSLALACAAFSQQNRESGRNQAPYPTEGFWPTRLMVDRFLDRLVEDMAERYEFDDLQMEMAREVLKERIPAFMQENRAQIQPLMNEFIEAQLDKEPPTPEAVADWAQRALPVLERVRTTAEDMAGEMREFMTEDQAAKLDGELAAFNTGITLATNKLVIWADGGYDPETEWTPRGEERERRAAEEEARIAAEMEAAELEASGRPQTLSAASKPASRPKDEWELYVDRFIEKYDLTLEQQQAARQTLATLQQQRDQWLRRRAADFDRVARALREADDDARKAAADEFERLNAPVERLFTQLKERLDKLPTRAQRQAAGADEPDDSAAATRPAGRAGR